MREKLPATILQCNFFVQNSKFLSLGRLDDMTTDGTAQMGLHLRLSCQLLLMTGNSLSLYASLVLRQHAFREY